MRWFIIYNAGANNEQVSHPISDGEEAYRLIWRTINGSAPTELTNAQLFGYVQRELAKYSLREASRRPHTVLYAFRLLNGSDFVRWCGRYQEALNDLAAQGIQPAWLVVNKKTVGEALELDDVLQNLRASREFRPYKNLIIYDATGGEEQMIVRCLITTRSK